MPDWPRATDSSERRTDDERDSTSPALETALAYHRAWTSKDLERAMSYIADDIICDAPAGRIEGAAAYRAFMGPFVQISSAPE